ncbi:hypothetical protein BDB00DRAFT_878186 [Zychaea mexicana]|uniref:uncharacterized protein n=1 Tax=Zychaea mexicana TaxID=64656 RepID=UPI0022FDB845|nr:uncharacterized protein BDB00DRAFT_878186 [Zychaea mexicana]KAI9484981.1 hypothetical protein BDB00DRAFT_878186 [Zychaea mexicana]
MTHASICTGVLTTNVEYRVHDRGPREAYARFTILCEGNYINVTAAKPECVMYLTENNVAEGHAIVVYSPFQISKYRGNQGTYQTAFRLNAHVLRLGLQWRTIIGDSQSGPPEPVTWEQVLERLEAQEVIPTAPTEEQVAALERCFTEAVIRYFGRRNWPNATNVVVQLFGRFGDRLWVPTSINTDEVHEVIGGQLSRTEVTGLWEEATQHIVAFVDARGTNCANNRNEEEPEQQQQQQQQQQHQQQPQQQQQQQQRQQRTARGGRQPQHQHLRYSTSGDHVTPGTENMDEDP